MIEINFNSDFFLLNQNIEHKSLFPNFLFETEKSIYEVLRFKHSPIFFNEHISRLNNSLNAITDSISELYIPTIEDINLLFHKNKTEIGNIRIDIFPKSKITITYIIPHFYPTKLLYKTGVKTVFQYDERPQQNIKLFHAEIKSRTQDILKDKSIFETILVNAKQETTEGSRSNLFFIQDKNIISAIDSQILNGITKIKMEEFLSVKKINLIKRIVKTEELDSFDAAYLTGTSIGSLPIYQMEDKIFNINNPILVKIINSFNKLR